MKMLVPQFVALHCFPVTDVDKEVWSLVTREKERQRVGLELVASENFCSRAVQECLGSCLANQHASGYPGEARRHGGHSVLDEVERLCEHRALSAFRLDPEEWGVNVQVYSGASANLAVLSGLLQPHDRVMGLDPADGGGLGAGLHLPEQGEPPRAGPASLELMLYGADPSSGLIDYEGLKRLATLFRPRLVVAGGSASPRLPDWARFRAVCDGVGALLLADLAHVAGLVAADLADDPFSVADAATAPAHRSLRGPAAGGLVFFRRHLEPAIRDAVFPRLQTAPHHNVMAAVAVALMEAQHDFFREYQHQAVKNAKALVTALHKLGYRQATGGTDTHLLLLDLRKQGLPAEAVAAALEVCGVTADVAPLPGTGGAGGLRLGLAALTSRGMLDRHAGDAALLLDRALRLAGRASREPHAPPPGTEQGTEQGTAWIRDLLLASPQLLAAAAELRGDVARFVTQFPMPGYDTH